MRTLEFKSSCLAKIATAALGNAGREGPLLLGRLDP